MIMFCRFLVHLGRLEPRSEPQQVSLCVMLGFTMFTPTYILQALCMVIFYRTKRFMMIKNNGFFVGCVDEVHTRG